MIVSNEINTSKYVSFKDLAKYVLVSGTTCLNPYNSTFKTLWVESGSGNTRSHQLRHNEAAGYGFTFHDGVNTGNTKLCLPEEMIALNPKIVFGGLSTGDDDDWATFKSIGADTFESEDKVFGRYVFKINFADNTYCTIQFETSYVDQDDSLHDQTQFWYEKCPDNTFYDQNGDETTESNYVGKELSSFELLSVDLIQGEEHGTINSWTYSGSSLYLNTKRGNYDCYTGKSEDGYFTTGVTQNDILVSNVRGYSNKNITVYMTPNIGITFSYTRDSQGCTQESAPCSCDDECSSECVPYSPCSCDDECSSECVPYSPCSCDDECSSECVPYSPCSCDDEVTPVYYTISFYSGSTRSGSSIVTTWGNSPFTSTTYEAGDTITYPTVAAVSQICRYAFYGGWKANQAGTISAPATMPSQDISVYYAVGYRSHTVTWYTRKSDVGTLENYSSGTFEYGTSVTYPPTPPIPVGYTWEGWSPASISSMGCSDTGVTGDLTKQTICPKEILPCSLECLCDGNDECSSDCPSNCPQEGSDTKMTLIVNYDMNGRIFSELTITVTFPSVNFSHVETCYPTSSTGTVTMQIDVSEYDGIQTTVQANSSGRVGQVYYPDEQLYVTIQGGGSTITLGNNYAYTINVSSAE